MHEAPKSLSDYRKQIDEALQDDFLRRTLDTFAVSYRANREAVFQEVDERGLIAQIAEAKDYACQHMEDSHLQCIAISCCCIVDKRKHENSSNEAARDNRADNLFPDKEKSADKKCDGTYFTHGTADESKEHLHV